MDTQATGWPWTTNALMAARGASWAMQSKARYVTPPEPWSTPPAVVGNIGMVGTCLKRICKLCSDVLETDWVLCCAGALRGLRSLLDSIKQLAHALRLTTGAHLRQGHTGVPSRFRLKPCKHWLWLRPASSKTEQFSRS